MGKHARAGCKRHVIVWPMPMGIKLWRERSRIHPNKDKSQKIHMPVDGRTALATPR